MIIALILGRGGSIGFPGKNTYEILGRPLMEYPLLAALNTPEIDEIYVSTDSEKIKEIGEKNGVNIISRPSYLCTKTAKHQDAMVHGYNYVKNLGKDIEQVVLLQCNAPCVLPKHISEGINMLRKNEKIDSAATVSEYTAFNPSRARKVSDERVISNFLSDEQLKGCTSERESQGKIYFTDGTFIVRPDCLEEIDKGLLPYPWMGKRSYAIMNWGGFDVDYSWQIPQVEFWLKEEGFTTEKLPY